MNIISRINQILEKVDIYYGVDGLVVLYNLERAGVVCIALSGECIALLAEGSVCISTSTWGVSINCSFTSYRDLKRGSYTNLFLGSERDEVCFMGRSLTNIFCGKLVKKGFS